MNAKALFRAGKKKADCNNAKYVIHNTSFEHGGSALKIPKTRAYYVNESMMQANQTGPNEFKFYGPNPGDFIWLVNERVGNMQPNTWYLLPTAYSITLVPYLTIDSSHSDCSDLSDMSELSELSDSSDLSSSSEEEP